MAKEAAKKNTSKTAKVLGLLTSPPSGDEPGEDTLPAEPAAVPQPKRAESAEPPRDTEVEALIRGALESELTAPEEEVLAAPGWEIPPSRKENEEETEMETDTEAMEIPALLTDPAPVPEAHITPEPPVLQAESAAAPAPATQPAPPPSGGRDGFYCFNVTQALVEAKAEKYMKLFGLCTCSRCHTDVVALALSNLPPKYIVANDTDMVPLLSVYEGKYNAAVISQVMNACKLVLKKPRH